MKYKENDEKRLTIDDLRSKKTVNFRFIRYFVIRYSSLVNLF